MPVSLVNRAEQRATPTATACSVSFATGTLTDGLLVVGLRVVDATAPTSVAFNGSSLTSIGNVGSLYYFRLVNPSQGTFNLTWTVASDNNCHYVISTWSGVDQATPIGTPVTGSGSSATPSTGSVTCPSNGQVLGILRHFYTGLTPTLSSGTDMGYFKDGNAVTIAQARRADTGSIAWSNFENYAYEIVGLPINSSSSGGSNDLAATATAGATASATLAVQRNLATTAVATALASGSLSINKALSAAAIGQAVGVAALQVFSQVWRAPTNAPNGTAVIATVYAGIGGARTIITQGLAVVAGGYVDIPGGGTAGAKALMHVDNYNDNTATTSIRGGPAIATLTSI